MVGFLKRLMPREDKFFDMFEAHAAKSLAAARALASVFEGGKAVGAHCDALMKAEDEADHITESVNEALRKSFITPFDRGDIKNLITDMDDAVDQMNKTAKAILLYEVSAFEPNMKIIAVEAVEQAKLLAEALPLLRNIGPNAARLHQICGKMIALEDESDRHHENGLKALIKGKAKKDAMAFIIGAELFGHLERVADKFEDVAHTIDGIVIEHV
jgi:predicted phosphate transport protein (TIGR00153 family)